MIQTFIEININEVVNVGSFVLILYLKTFYYVKFRGYIYLELWGIVKLVYNIKDQVAGHFVLEEYQLW